MKKLVTLACLAASVAGVCGLYPVTANADAAKGEAIFGPNCASCHGPKGAGDGPVAASLPPEMKPANLATGKYKYVKDETTFAELLKKGGMGVGLSAMMPPQPSLSDKDIKSLWQYLESLKKN